MHLYALISVICLVLTFSHVHASGTYMDTRELGIADIPACGLLCMISTVPTSGCALDDTACICSNTEIAAKVSTCMLANCTMQDSLETARVQADLCNLSKESQRLDIFMWTGIIYSIAVVFVCLRIAGKLVNKRLALDDYIVVCAIVFCALPVGCALAMTERGFGEHLWNLEDGALLPILRFFFICWSTYVIVLGLIKVSLVLFYLEIFHTTSFRITAYVVLTAIIINSTIIFFLTVFICDPVESFWNRDIKGKCLDLQAIAYANSASAIAQDIILLVLPLFFIRKLQMKRYRKAAVGFMFAIGTFGCVATIIRLHTLTKFKISMDPTWDYVPVTIWTELELAAGFVCVSLPSIRVLVVKLLPESVKEFLSYVTHPSKQSKQSNSDPKQGLPVARPSQKEWRKPSGWSWISLGADQSESQLGPRKSIMSGRWPWVATSPLTSHFSHARTGSRRLNSAMSNYSDAGVVLSRPPYGEQKNAVELREVPDAMVRSHDRQSVLGDEVTALPTIGCLPERSYSHERANISKGMARMWSRDNSG
ncbi:cytidine and deoxycytidylate deaminase zinc-binding region [Alternaria alternata]|nr:cytidine and deoxycytidylate deaminase zinc-binding region [Alternaria alternata]